MRQEAMEKLISAENLKKTLNRLVDKQARMVFKRCPPAEIAAVGTQIEQIRKRLEEAEQRENLAARASRG